MKAVRRWQVLWGITVAVTFVAGGLYVRANLPPRPGFYWLFPYPFADLTELRRQAEASPSYQAALRSASNARNAMVLRGLAVWIVGAAILYGVGLTTDRGHRRD
jgi:hypothetical protein